MKRSDQIAVKTNILTYQDKMIYPVAARVNRIIAEIVNLVSDMAS